MSAMGTHGTARAVTALGPPVEGWPMIFGQEYKGQLKPMA
jgi:hypothetical protein